MKGEPNADAIAISALMNARGVMELIINIGLALGWSCLDCSPCWCRWQC
jgi:hypothetical protein